MWGGGVKGFLTNVKKNCTFFYRMVSLMDRCHAHLSFLLGYAAVHHSGELGANLLYLHKMVDVFVDAGDLLKCVEVCKCVTNGVTEDQPLKVNCSRCHRSLNH